jgi:hypothetical protein
VTTHVRRRLDAPDIEFDADGFVTLYHGFLERPT